MSGTHYLSLEDALSFIRALAIGPVRDLGLLDSALARPRSSAFGQDAYPTIELKAAAVLDSLVNNRPLLDGNKRLAWLSTTVFLALNDVAVELSDDEAFDLVWDVASGSHELADIASRLRPRREVHEQVPST